MGFKVIDLFAGAGGLTEGFMMCKSFEFLAHIEWESPMVNTLRNNLVKRWGYSEEDAKQRVIEFDIQKTQELINGHWKDETIKKYEKQNSSLFVKNGLKGVIGEENVDIIIGGPPCQAYSIAGRAQDPYSMKRDYRNYLFESFVKIVDFFKPNIFVFENVPGILSAKPGDKFVINRIYDAFKSIGYLIREPKIMKQSIFSSSDFGVPQDRKRVIIFGVKEKGNINLEDLYSALNKLKTKNTKITVQDAIGFLPKFKPLDKPSIFNGARCSHKLIGNKHISLHNARFHSSRDIKVFKYWIKNKMNYASTNEKLKFYKKITGHSTNHNKYRNLEWNKPSPTIVSHLSKDGLMFIHPDITQARSITIREAALLQTFPLDFEFVGSTPYCYKMIGNAVPVLFAEKIAESIKKVIK